MEQIDDRQTEDKLSALDPNLSLLAFQAAIELDNLVHQEHTDLTATKRLASLLSRTFEKRDEPPSQHLLIDPTTLTLMSRALTASQWGKQVQTVSDLVQEAWNIADNLQNPDIDSDSELIKKIRTFCAALSEGAASYLQAVYALRPAHPYRR